MVLALLWTARRTIGHEQNTSRSPDSESPDQSVAADLLLREEPDAEEDEEEEDEGNGGGKEEDDDDGYSE
jgi:hypothetical protein